MDLKSFGSPTALRCKESASYILNNLSSNSNNKLIYIHDNHIWYIEDNNMNNFIDHAIMRRVVYREAEAIAHAIIHRTDYGDRILVASQQGSIHMFDNNGTTSLSYQRTPVDETPTCISCDSKQHAFVGCVSGNILVYSIKKSSILYLRTLCEHEYSITSTYAHARHLATGDDEGNIVVWRFLDNGNTEVCAKFAGIGIPCTSIVLDKDRCIAAYANGIINIFNISKNELKITINAHTRTINALSYDEKYNLLASVSDDTYVNIWQLPHIESNDNRVKNFRSLSISNRLLVGVQFCGTAPKRSLAIVAYDSRMLNVIELQ